MKGDHFVLADNSNSRSKQTNNFNTSSSIDYNYKGNASKIKARLNANRINDLQNSHFTIGN